MGVRKNAKTLTAAEREDLVQALVSMKADIVNPAAPPADRYSRWDEAVALHRMIQSVEAPGGFTVNFGHGGTGAYGFLSWHRYFLLRLEQQLQSYVPGVMLPYWDWTDPVGTIMIASFLGPNGDPLENNRVQQGYFAEDAPGTGANLTPAPAWWPPGLTGWTLHAAFGSLDGGLRRQTQPAANLPAVATLRSCLDKANYHDFQLALEAGTGTVPFHQLHNALHVWFGGGTHMASVIGSPFDPMFYLHHCNVDRLWAQWQMDGHATEYPAAGGNAHHRLNDPMFPWVGALPGYSSNNSFAPILLPDFTAEPVVTPADVLDHRALGYGYDTQVVVGVSLDRSGSMMGLTPDPMIVAAPDVTKWEAAKRGVAAFFQDCEAAYASTEAYVVAGVETFRSAGGNQFNAVFAGTPYGLVKAAGAYSRAGFEGAVAPLTPGGGTPLADALTHANSTLVTPPFANLPAGERRYLALFTDGKLTSGSPLASIPDGSLAPTAVFTMGFGTGADVDYPTLTALAAKGQTLPTTQVFHGENAGTIDKFYSQALAAAIGYVPILDPVLELFEGEHSHFEFTATSAEDSFFLTAQGMDFEDDAWSYHLMGPDGQVIYADGPARHGHGAGDHGCHCGRRPSVTARRGRGRLSLFLSRDSADAAHWVGTWTLMVAWRAKVLDAMAMTDVGELLVPVAAGPIRGPRWARLAQAPSKRRATRTVPGAARHRLDVRPTATGRDGRPATTVVINVYARTRLKIELRPRGERALLGQPLGLHLETRVLAGTASTGAALARLVAPAVDLASFLTPERVQGFIPTAARIKGAARDQVEFDTARVLARIEAQNPEVARQRDEELTVVSHHGGAPHVHIEKTDVPGAYHVGLWVEGVYYPEADTAPDGGHDHGGGAAPAGRGEPFQRLLTVSVGLARG